MPGKFTLLAASLLLLGGSLVYLQNTPDENHSANVPGHQQQTVPRTHNAPRTSLPAPTLPAETLPPLPEELRGLEPDRHLATDSDGNLQPNRGLRRLFDFYLANVDREPLPLVLQRINAALSRQLPELARQQALALLERYVDYRMAVGDLQEQLPGGVTLNGFDLPALRQRQAELEALRRSHFGPDESNAFFGKDQKLDDFTLARLAIEQNPALDRDEKQQQLELLEQQLPEEELQARKRATLNGDVYQLTEQLKDEGASNADLFQLRAETLGETAAIELAKLDRQQSDWQGRLAHYREENQKIQQSGLSQNDRDAALSALRKELFSSPEQLRVRALEALD